MYPYYITVYNMCPSWIMTGHVVHAYLLLVHFRGFLQAHQGKDRSTISLYITGKCSKTTPRNKKRTAGPLLVRRFWSASTHGCSAFPTWDSLALCSIGVTVQFHVLNGRYFVCKPFADRLFFVTFSCPQREIPTTFQHVSPRWDGHCGIDAERPGRTDARGKCFATA